MHQRLVRSSQFYFDPGLKVKRKSITRYLPIINQWSQRVIAITEKQFLAPHADAYKAECPILKEFYGLCDGERFASQPSLGNCTGFMTVSNFSFKSANVIVGQPAASFSMIGFPSGLPMKMAQGSLIEQTKDMTLAAIDAFEGNSVSPTI